jgi:hypothetical protein
MSEWISVEDRLPESGEKILVWCSVKGSWFSGFFTKYDDFVIWAIYEGSAISSNVTHWMPPPEPPSK